MNTSYLVTPKISCVAAFRGPCLRAFSKWSVWSAVCYTPQTGATVTILRDGVHAWWLCCWC